MLYVCILLREERNQCFSCPPARAGSSPDQRVLQLFPHQLHGCLWSRIKRCCSGDTQDYMNATRKTDSATLFCFCENNDYSLQPWALFCLSSYTCVQKMYKIKQKEFKSSFKLCLSLALQQNVECRRTPNGVFPESTWVMIFCCTILSQDCRHLGPASWWSLG